MRTLVRVTFRQHQFEIVALGTLLLIAVVGLIVIPVIWSMLPLAECTAAGSMAPEDVTAELMRKCTALFDTVYVLGGIGQAFVVAGVAGPAVAGVILGAGLVSKEIERGTAVMPWTMGRSRRRWLLERVLVIAALVGVVALALAALTDNLLFMFDQTPLDRSLFLYEARGWMVPARGMVGLAAGVLAGAITGRAVPALLVGALVASLSCLGVYSIGNELNQAQAIEFEGPGGLSISEILRDPTGAIVSYDEAYARISVEDDASWARFQAEFTSSSVGVPGSESRIVTGREVLMLVGLAFVMTAGAVVVVERRRPY